MSGPLNAAEAGLHWPEGEAEGWTGRERVALGCWSMLAANTVWYELTNVHEEPARHFAVDGAEVQRVLADMRERRLRPHILWHSHEATVEPSEHDIAEFPHWIAVGVVWACASATLTTYDKNGVSSVATPLISSATAGI